MAHIWEKSYPQGVSWDAPLPPPVPLESLLETAASKWPRTHRPRLLRSHFHLSRVARPCRASREGAAGARRRPRRARRPAPAEHAAFRDRLFRGADGRRPRGQLQSARRAARAAISARRLRGAGHDHARPADALSADRGAQGHRQSSRRWWSAASRTFCRRRSRAPSAPRRIVSPGPAASSILPRSSPMTAPSRATRTAARGRGRRAAIHRRHHRPAQGGHADARQLLRRDQHLQPLGPDDAATKKRKKRWRCCRCSTSTG